MSAKPNKPAAVSHSAVLRMSQYALLVRHAVPIAKSVAANIVLVVVGVTVVVSTVVVVVVVDVE